MFSGTKSLVVCFYIFSVCCSRFTGRHVFSSLHIQVVSCGHVCTCQSSLLPKEGPWTDGCLTEGSDITGETLFIAEELSFFHRRRATFQFAEENVYNCHHNNNDVHRIILYMTDFPCHLTHTLQNRVLFYFSPSGGATESSVLSFITSHKLCFSLKKKTQNKQESKSEDENDVQL